MKFFFPYWIRTFLVLASIAPFAFAQDLTTAPSNSSDKPVTTQTKTRVTPGIQYDAGWLHRLFAGAHWRDMWVTEFEAEILDLDSFAGGLTPKKKGGSMQTLNLRLKGNDGREYKFRSMNKDGKRALPPELQESIVADIYQDQISIGNPMASVVVPRLMDAVGVLNAEPRIVVMQRSERLGEFNDEFAGVLGTIEENPKAGKDDDPGFCGAGKVIDDFEIFDKLREDNDERIDAVNYLKLRLVDILLGDRDRHGRQYKWAGYKRNGKRDWLPIPGDRDFAFGRYDGFFPWAAGLFVHSAVGFGESYPSILELTWIGRHLDRRFLNGLDKPVWDSLTTYIRNTLTDSVMQDALRTMPLEMYQKSGGQMFRMLKARRDKLDEAANEFYTLVSDVVDVYGSDKAERAEIKRLNNKLVEVNVYKKKSGELLYSRMFSNEYTNEIRIHLLGGDDVANVEGNGRSGILVRVLGGDGRDELVDRSSVSGTVFYDDDTSSTIVRGAVTRIVLDVSDSLKSKEEIPEPVVEDRYRIWRVLPLLSFNSDDGVIIGATSNMTQYGFRVEPHAHYLALNANYAPRFSHYDVQAYIESYNIVNNTRVELDIRASDLGLTAFYGIGNETSFNKALADANYYKTNYQSISLQPAVNIQMSRQMTLRVGTLYKYSNAKVTKGSFLDQFKQYGLGIHSALAISASFSYEGRDLPIAPSKGLYCSVGGIFYPAVFRNDFAFGKANVDVRVYLPARIFTDLVFAFHAGGEKTFGTYPFYHASVIGGASTVRGYTRERFAGDASAFGQAEMRASLTTISFIPAQLGLTVFADAGRVFLAGERSKKWHSAFGGGLWLNAINRFVLNCSVARSPEGVSVYVTSGFAF